MIEPRIVGDWGSTRLRLWRLEEGQVTDRREGPGVIGLQLAPADVLLDAIASWRADGARRVTLCGMAGARGGLYEAGYAPCPLDAPQWAERTAAFALDGLAVRIAAGCAHDRGGGFRDLMRGEETQLFGAMALNPALTVGRHLLILPGTHSKWAVVDNGRIASFRSFLTGELFARLRGSSLLPEPASAPGGEEAAFAAGVEAARDGGLLGNLFLTRSAQVDAGESPEWASTFLSGLLIGSECVEMTGTAPPAALVRIIGAPGLAEHYAAALARFGAGTERLDADACTLAGLRMIDAYD
ncbi:2-dehydro-3-deoxygalactonokinase [Sphingopyxis sp. JAI128]|uniref:2-dehydro-3-deoxygalactonokinase n=1 Tax=Sphingopyxis sp. JAI128 TaxID=2723066 RepID=UPI00183C9B69|nr:2-dehydro-3-deoxygalactonokinase [Sphingopyxis sp. JAI128]MBB6427818.1 2-dehydro-3-deoxygalactonokinase [Sphingopyxis sp. JAI128]